MQLPGTSPAPPRPSVTSDCSQISTGTVFSLLTVLSLPLAGTVSSPSSAGTIIPTVTVSFTTSSLVALAQLFFSSLALLVPCWSAGGAERPFCFLPACAAALCLSLPFCCVSLGTLLLPSWVLVDTLLFSAVPLASCWLSVSTLLFSIVSLASCWFVGALLFSAVPLASCWLSVDTLLFSVVPLASCWVLVGALPFSAVALASCWLSVGVLYFPAAACWFFSVFCVL
ncbi:hypothetical protein E2C01_031976 [Portunus trituberculatus]|uniref:Uncharacterized protein n=1 Tax=Portunus trituberculatus TaxID=210409 RepID=A0A5B7EZM6_PORTR|nr:hypothetical protein [Portunus trituberculatus]